MKNKKQERKSRYWNDNQGIWIRCKESGEKNKGIKGGLVCLPVTKTKKTMGHVGLILSCKVKFKMLIRHSNIYTFFFFSKGR